MGLALIWKPKGVESQALLGEFKRGLDMKTKGRKGIGHNGTLDPFAQGLLCFGWKEGRKLLHPLSDLSKTYKGKIWIGVESDTLDPTGQVDFSKNTTQLHEELAAMTAAQLEEFLADQLGMQAQIPPMYSAKHVDGKRAYEWARKGISKELKPKNVNIIRAEHLELKKKQLDSGQEIFEWCFRVEVSAGTYVRCLARDWCEALWAVPGILGELTREALGPFRMPQGHDPAKPCALGIDELSQVFEITQLAEEEAQRLQNGGQFRPRPSRRMRLLVGSQKEPLAWCHAPDGRLGRVFCQDPLEN